MDCLSMLTKGLRFARPIDAFAAKMSHRVIDSFRAIAAATASDERA